MPWWVVASPLAVLGLIVWLRWQPKLPARLFAAVDTALRAALRGDLPEADRAQTEARRWCARSRGLLRTTARARLLLVDVVLLCRSERLEEAWAALHRDWKTFENTPGGWLAEACLLRGYLAYRTDRDVEPWLGLLGASGGATLIWMANEWPELGAFLDAYGLRS
jgi:hypothetical protein